MSMKHYIFTLTLASLCAETLHAWPTKAQPQATRALSATSSSILGVITLATIAYGLYALLGSNPPGTLLSDTDDDQGTFNRIPTLHARAIANDLTLAVSRFKDRATWEKASDAVTTGHQWLRKPLKGLFGSRRERILQVVRELPDVFEIDIGLLMKESTQ